MFGGLVFAAASRRRRRGEEHGEHRQEDQRGAQQGQELHPVLRDEVIDAIAQEHVPDVDRFGRKAHGTCWLRYVAPDTQENMDVWLEKEFLTYPNKLMNVCNDHAVSLSNHFELHNAKPM